MINKEKYILSCDWGTSSFRLRLLSVSKPGIIAEERNDNGIFQTYEHWKQSEDHESKISFYLDIINRAIKKIGNKISFSLNGIPLIISGMASSSRGMTELPYKKVPFATDGSDLIVRKPQLEKNDFVRDIFIVSGASANSDVMRGEETQIVGCAVASGGEQTFIFPGTHSKHVKIKDNKVIAFKTYMTGEFFSLLSEKSILAEGINKTLEFNKANYKRSFRHAVLKALDHNLLHSSFLVRTNYLLKKLTKEENYFYLAGLMIGTELKDIPVKRSLKVNLVANPTLLPLYTEALKTVNKNGASLLVKNFDADEASARGHLAIYKLLSGH